MKYEFENEDVDKKEEIFKLITKRNSDFSKFGIKKSLVEMEGINTMRFREEVGSLN